MENFNLAEAVLEFATGSSAEWDNFTLPIPSNVVVFTTDNQVFRRGNGVDLYSTLTDGPSIAGIAAGGQEVVNTLIALNAGHEDMIIVINNEVYDASTTTVQDIVTRLDAIFSKDNTQTGSMDAIDGQAGAVDLSISGADDGKLTVLSGGKMSPGVIVAEMPSIVAGGALMHIRSIKLHTTLCCSNEVTELEGDNTYYATVDGMHDEQDLDDLTFGLTSVSTDLTITLVERNQFKVVVGSDPVIGNTTFVATLDYSGDLIERNVSVPIVDNRIFVSIYGGINAEHLIGVVVDSVDNIYAVGHTGSEGSGFFSCLIIKYDKHLNILARKVYGGNGDDYFDAVTLDSNDNIIAVGRTHEGIGGYGGLIVKFDTSLNILVSKNYCGSLYAHLFGVAVDANDNIICCGWTQNGGGGGTDGWIIKFDTNINLLAAKTYGGSGTDYMFGIAVDSLGNIFAVGNASLATSAAIVLKFDNDLNPLSQKMYNGSGNDYIMAIAIDSNDNVFVVGYNDADGQGANDVFVMKLDNALTIIAAKTYGGTGNDYGMGIYIDSNDNVAICGYNDSDGQGGNDAFVVNLNNDLNQISAKLIGGVGYDSYKAVIFDSNDNVICTGLTNSEGQGGYDGLITKYPRNIPSGTFVGSILANTTSSDSTLTLADVSLTMSDSVLTMTVNNLTLGVNSTLILADSNLTYVSDILG